MRATMTLSSPLDGWRPYPVHDLAPLFAGAPFRWWVSGGIALELHCGRTWRDHADTDIGVLRKDTAAVYEWMDGWELAVAAGGVLSTWSGRPLSEGEHNIWARRSGERDWEIDFTVGAGTNDQWVYRRDSRISRAWRTAVLYTDSQLPYLAPDIQLLFKSKTPRAKDEDDAGRAIPLLGFSERSFLAANLPAEHPWQRLLATR